MIFKKHPPIPTKSKHLELDYTLMQNLLYMQSVYFLKKGLISEEYSLISGEYLEKTTPQKSGFWVGLENVEALIRNIFPVPYAPARCVYIVRYFLQP